MVNRRKFAIHEWFYGSSDTRFFFASFYLFPPDPAGVLPDNHETPFT